MEYFPNLKNCVRNLSDGAGNKMVDLTQIGNRELFAPRDNTDNCWLLYPGLTVTVLGNSEQFFLAFWTNICFTTFTTTYNEFEFSLLWMIHSDIKSVLWEFFSIVKDPSYPILPQIAWIFAIYPYKTYFLWNTNTTDKYKYKIKKIRVSWVGRSTTYPFKYFWILLFEFYALSLKC